MRDDLKGLEISPKELQRLTNLPVKDELINIIAPLGGFVKQVIEKIKGTEGATVVFISFSSLVAAYIIFDFILKLFNVWLTVPTWFVLMVLGLWMGGVTQIGLYLLWKKRYKLLKANMTHSLQILLNDVDRYNGIIKAIDINDQIEDAGNEGVSIRERERVIEALKLTTNNLVRSFKNEKILRKNKNFIIKNFIN